MLVSKTPLRMSFCGGGSDLKSFYSRHKGAVVSTSIDKYIYVTANKKFDQTIRCSYSQTENTENASQIQHPIIRETLRFLEINTGIEITTIADIPSAGSGLGSSSSFAVGLVNVLKKFLSQEIKKNELANTACKIEIELCDAPIGKQDQYAATFGGLNLIEFEMDENVIVTPINISNDYLNYLNRMIVVLYTGVSRKANSILIDQKNNIENDNDKNLTMRSMVNLAYEFKTALEKENTEELGKILMENWELKRKMSEKISNKSFDSMINKAIKNGALGGKLLGAGAGGFLMFLVPENRRKQLISSMDELEPFNCKLSDKGSELFQI